MADNTTNNKRIAKNTLFLYIRMIFVMFVGLYTSRIVLRTLGASDYGIFNVVGGFVSLFAFLNASFSSSIQRFYNYEGGRTGEEGFTKVYSAGLRVHAILALVVFVLLESFGIWYVNNIMVLPEGRLMAANVVFQCAIFNLIFVILQIPFTGVILAKEKMDYYAFVSIIDIVLKLGLILLLPHVSFDKLIAFAFIQLILQFVVFTLYASYAKIKFRFLKLTKKVDKALLKGILSFSGWTLIGSFAFMFKGQGVNLLLNYFFGTIVNAARGVAFQINGAIIGFARNLSVSFSPQLTQSYAEGDKRRTYTLFTYQSRFCYFLTLMLITPVIIEMDYMLHLWLGDAVPEHTNLFASLVLIDALISTLNTPVTQVVFATGRIKGYQIWSAAVNIFLIPLCWVFLKMGFDAWIVFALTIVVSILCQIACLIVMHHVFSYSYWEYIRNVIFPCLIMTLLVPLAPLAIKIVMSESLLRLLLVVVVSLAVTSALLYFVFFSKSEKQLVQGYIKKLLKHNK